MINLVSNASKFTNVKGKIDISFDLEESIENTIKICVKDNGIGIGKEDQEKIFDIFLQINNNNKGLVLGYLYERKYLNYLVERYG